MEPSEHKPFKFLEVLVQRRMEGEFKDCLRARVVQEMKSDEYNSGVVYGCDLLPPTLMSLPLVAREVLKKIGGYAEVIVFQYAPSARAGITRAAIFTHHSRWLSDRELEERINAGIIEGRRIGVCALQAE